MSPNHLHYSWSWSGVHFVMLGAAALPPALDYVPLLRAWCEVQLILLLSWPARSVPGHRRRLRQRDRRAGQRLCQGVGAVGLARPYTLKLRVRAAAWRRHDAPECCSMLKRSSLKRSQALTRAQSRLSYRRPG